jgi:uncharacterized membrane protein YdjX (TVP38/TMEM64 family)
LNAPEQTPLEDHSIGSYLRRLGPAAPWAIAVTALPPLGLLVAIWIFSTTEFGGWLRDHQPWTWVGFTLSYWVLGLCLLPSLSYSVIAGFCFGFWPGLAASIIGYLGAACGGMHISRFVANERVMSIIRENPKALAVHQALLNSSGVKTFVIIMLLRLAPNIPFAMINFVLGSAGVPTRTFLLATCLGMIPRATAATWIASTMTKFDPDVATNKWFLIVGIIAVIAVVLIISNIAKRALEKLTLESTSENPAIAPTN